MVNRSMERFFSAVRENRMIDREEIIMTLNALYDEATRLFVSTTDANEAIYRLAERETIGKVIDLIVNEEKEAAR